MREPGRDYIGLAPLYSKEFGTLVQRSIDEWNNWIKRNGLRRQWQHNFALMHNADPNGAAFGETSFEIVGENGELVRVGVNEMRNLLTHLLNLIVAQPPALLAKARNADPESIEAAQDFDVLLEHYMQTWARGCIRKQTRKAAEQCTFFPFGAVLVEWDSQAGEVFVADESGAPVRSGDVYVKARSVYDVVFDPSIEDETELTWVLVRDWENRYNLAAKFPDASERILSLPSRVEVEAQNSWGQSESTDQVCVWKFYHKPTLAVPEGRYALSVEPETILYDGPNPYGELPVFFMRASEGHGTIYGYPPANDIAPINIAINMMYSAMTTNYAAGGTQNIAVKAGDEPSVNAIAGGMRVIEYNEAPPQAISLVQNAPGSFDFISLLRQTSELLSGINSAQRGDPDANVKTAKQQGMLQALAVQYANGMQGSYAQLLEDIGNFLLKLFGLFANTERLTVLVGKDKVARSLRWSSDTFEHVQSVAVEQVDPAMKTLGFRTDQAAFLADRGLVSDPVGYIDVMTTGNLNALIEPEIQERSLVREENSALLRGEEAPVLVTDSHEKHLKFHKMLLDSPRVRREQAVVQNILQHMQAHLDMQGSQGLQPGALSAEVEPASPGNAAPPPEVQNEQSPQPV